MNKTKRFTSATFTKKVDHETGRHYTRRAPSEPAVCGECGSVYHNRRWITAGEAAARVRDFDLSEAHVEPCPACQQQKEGLPRGFLFCGGSFLATRREEIERLLNNEANRAAHDNPLARIMSSKSEKAGGLTVTTTTEHLAQRLGHALEKAFGGEVRYDFSHENKLARVYWSRD